MSTVPAGIAERLGPNESLTLVTPLVPVPSDLGNALAIGPAIPVAMALRRIGRRRSAKALSSALGVPVPEQAVLAVTSQRLLLFAQRKRQVGDFLGEIAVGDVRRVETSTVGKGWRTCLLTFVDERQAAFRVVGDMADRLARAFPG